MPTHLLSEFSKKPINKTTEVEPCALKAGYSTSMQYVLAYLSHVEPIHRRPPVCD